MKMNKNLSVLLVLLLSLTIIVSSFSGCTSKSIINNGTEKLLTANGDSETILAFNKQVASLENLSAPIAPHVDMLPNDVDVIFTPDSFGAKGNGSDDDTTAVIAAINAAKTVDGYVHFKKGTYKVGNFEVPANVTLSFAGSAKLAISSGKTVAINSYLLIAPNVQIFTGEGSTGYMPNLRTAYSEWWGAVVNNGGNDAVAIQKAINSANNIYFINGTYNITTPVIIPQARTMSVTGTGYKSTTFVINGGINAFQYEKSNSTASILSMSYFTVDESGRGRSSVFVNYNGGKLLMEGINFWGTKHGASIANTANSYFRNTYGNGNKCTFNLAAGNSNTTLNRCMQLNGGGHVTATNGSGLHLINSSSVWSFGIDLNISNYTDFTTVQAGYDLGYRDNNLGMGEAAIKLTNVNGFKIEGVWIASNSGLSFLDQTSTGGIVREAKERIGLLLVNSQNGIVSGCTITNHKIGTKVDSSPSGAGTVTYLGNTFVGNTTNDVFLTNAKNVTFSMNFHNQYPSDFNIKEVTGSGCVNVVFQGESFRRQISSDSALITACGGSGVTVDSNFYGVN